ncbi:MAG: histidine kinase, partial [Chloroflexota bacterium]
MKHLGWLTRDRTVGARRTPTVLDWLLAVALLALALVEVASGAFPGPVALAAVLQLVTIIPVAFRRLLPVAAITVAALVTLPYTVVYGAGNSLAGAAAFLMLAYAVGRYADRRVLPIGIAMGVLMIVELWIGGRLAGLADITYLLIFYGAALGLGVALRAQIRRSTVLEAVADRAEREKEAMAQAAVLEERARIARELHDVVAHNVGLIVLQAGGARSVLGADPDRAR